MRIAPPDRRAQEDAQDEVGLRRGGEGGLRILVQQAEVICAWRGLGEDAIVVGVEIRRGGEGEDAHARLREGADALWSHRVGRPHHAGQDFAIAADGRRALPVHHLALRKLLRRTAFYGEFHGVLPHLRLAAA